MAALGTVHNHLECSLVPILNVCGLVPILNVCVSLVIGASLSEPHTSVTALRMHVYVYLWTDHLLEILNKRV